MKKIQKTFLSLITLLFVLCLSVVSTPAQTTTPANTGSCGQFSGKDNRDQKITCIKTKADSEIDRRITSLNSAVANINGLKKLTADQKTTYVSQIQAQISSLTSLKAKIDADTDITVLITDSKSIRTEYRIYALFLPKTNLLVAADGIVANYDLFNQLVAKLQPRIQEAANEGHDTTELSSYLTDLKNKIADANTQAQNIVNTVMPLVPGQVNDSAIANARNMLSTAVQDFKTAQTDAQNIVTALKAFGPKLTPGWLHTQGKQILDYSGNVVRLTGVNIATLGTTQWHRFVQNPPLYDLIKSSNFNFVRLTISWGDMEPNPPVGVTHTYDQTYIQTVDGAINNFKSRGIKVLLDMTQSGWSSAVTSGGGGYGMPAWLYPPSSNPTHPGQPWGDRDAKRDFFVNGRGQDGYISALTFMTKRYKDDPTVFAVDMMNEPYSITPTLMPQDMHLNAFYLKVGTAIRASNPNITLVYQDSSIKGAIDKGGANPEADLALTGPLTLPNSIYETHLYDKDWIPDGKAVADLFLTRVNRWRVPALIGEFNGFGQAGGDLADLTQPQATELAAFMSYMKQSRINWSYFQFQSGKAPIVNGTTQQVKPILLRTLQNGM